MPTWDEKAQAEVDAAARMARMSRVDFLGGQIRTSKTMDKAETDAATAKAAIANVPTNTMKARP